MGTCAGLILISRETNDERVPGMGILDTEIRRNAYGRQINSFIDNIKIDEIGDFQAVFIRAPVISSPGRSRVMARRGDEIVMVRQENANGHEHQERYFRCAPAKFFGKKWHYEAAYDCEQPVRGLSTPFFISSTVWQ